ncbi:MAG: Rieske 2Fe-2S domain-containing protein [Candidatus Poribacteria bacterium]|nr:Rieske 2Fe-2S domain-containing protein [Candidatus Poribacteria bacterium]
MPKESHLNKREDKVSRRRFLAYSTRFVVGGCGLAVIGCGESDDDADILLPSEPENPTQPVSTQDPEKTQEDPEEPPEPQLPQDEPEEPPPGVEVQMRNALKQVGGGQKVSDREVLDALNIGEALLLVRVDKETVAANTIICTHQRCEVAYNERRERLDCPCHGSRYDLNGKVIQGPARRPLKHFKATIHEDSVFLEEA